MNSLEVDGLVVAAFVDDRSVLVVSRAHGALAEILAAVLSRLADLGLGEVKVMRTRGSEGVWIAGCPGQIRFLSPEGVRGRSADVLVMVGDMREIDRAHVLPSVIGSAHGVVVETC